MQQGKFIQNFTRIQYIQYLWITWLKLASKTRKHCELVWSCHRAGDGRKQDKTEITNFGVHFRRKEKNKDNFLQCFCHHNFWRQQFPIFDQHNFLESMINVEACGAHFWLKFLEMAQPKEPPAPPPCTKCGEPGKEVVWDSHLQLYRSKCSKIFVTMKNPCRPSAHEAFTTLWFALPIFLFLGPAFGRQANFAPIICFWARQVFVFNNQLHSLRPGDGVAWEWLGVIPKIEDAGQGEDVHPHIFSLKNYLKKGGQTFAVSGLQSFTCQSCMPLTIPCDRSDRIGRSPWGTNSRRRWV